jgi:methionyl aminopeptidase
MKNWKINGYKIRIKEPQEIQAMREGGKILGQILYELEKLTQPGITSLELDEKAMKMMQSFGVKPSFKGYQGFPNALCVSVNEQVVHGIPNADYQFQKGDIVTIDCGVHYKNLHTDSAITIPIGDIDSTKRLFINTTKKALEKAIEKATPKNNLVDISQVIQQTAENEGYTIIHDLTGHGIGQDLHEDPPVLNFVSGKKTFELKPGMTLAIEPILSMGGPHIKVLRDGWTYVTKDNSLSAQYEHTILITDGAAEILTKRPNE